MRIIIGNKRHNVDLRMNHTFSNMIILVTLELSCTFMILIDFLNTLIANKSSFRNNNYLAKCLTQPEYNLVNKCFNNLSNF